MVSGADKRNNSSTPIVAIILSIMEDKLQKKLNFELDMFYKLYLHAIKPNETASTEDVSAYAQSRMEGSSLQEKYELSLSEWQERLKAWAEYRKKQPEVRDDKNYLYSSLINDPLDF